MTKREKQLEDALREMVALFHARNSNFLQQRNPYQFWALLEANEALTGNALECGFDVTEACERLRENEGMSGAFREATP